MIKKTILALACGIFVVPMAPTLGECHHHHGGGDVLFWGITGLLVGSALVTASSPPPATVVYAEPPPPAYQPPAYGYDPQAPAENCRWERYALDGYGRVMMDGYGRPVKEYMVGPCGQPPY